MYVVEKSIWIDRSPDEVFDFHANHANRADWHGHVTRPEMITPLPLGIGTRFEIDANTAKRPTPMVIEITTFDPPRYYSYRSFAANAKTDSHHRFEAENGGTRFRVRIELYFKGIAKPFGWLILKFGLEKHFEQALIEINEVMENN
jgi:hypothetical protein